MSLTNTIEAIVFAAGDPIPVKEIVQKLGVSLASVNSAIDELREKYGEESGIQLLTFNGKLQFASNPKYKAEISSVITPITEKEFTKTILECAALIAYKQPVTRGELEEIRQASCDYAIHTLMNLGMIEAVGRKDTLGKPILYATTDNFLKRFRLNSIDELPDYDELMAQIAEMNSAQLPTGDESNYLYSRPDYEQNGEDETQDRTKRSRRKEEEADDYGSEMPEFLRGEDTIIKID